MEAGWPCIPDWCDTFDIDPFVSPQAKLWAPTVVDIQNPAFVAQLLTTFANQEAAVHLDKTPILAASVTQAPPASAIKQAPDEPAPAEPAPALAPAVLGLVPSSVPPSPRAATSSAAASGAPPADTNRILADCLRKLEKRHQAQMAQLRVELTAAAPVLLPASPPREPARSRAAAPSCYNVIDLARNSTLEKLQFDVIKSVQQYSPAFSAAEPSRRSQPPYGTRQALFESDLLQLSWSEAHQWTFE
jgi:hypothetical protein